MIIKEVKFITSFNDMDKYSGGTAPEICFAGRSNAGKSTFINTLTGQKIANVSSQPGRTRLVNMFSVNGGQFNIVDLPGYGYSEASKKVTAAWQPLIEGYLQASKTLKRVFLICDCRVDSPLDKQMLEYLFYYGVPFTVLASKSDKLPRAQLNKRVIALAAFFGIGRDDITPVSHSGDGRSIVLKLIDGIFEPTITEP